MTSRRLFSALFHNELEKIWAHRGKVLIIAFILIVLGGSFIAYRSYEGSVQGYQSEVASTKSQIIQEQHQLSHVHGSQKRALQEQLSATRSTLQQLQQNSFVTTNVSIQITSLKKSLKGTPPAFQGNTREQLALDYYRVQHGMTQYHPSGHGGYRLVGQVFAGFTTLLFALVALGISADRISSEIELGTWGGLLLHAPRRRLVYLAKLAASLVVTWAFMVASALGFFVTAGIFLGFGNPNNPHAVSMKLATINHASGTQVTIPIQSFHLIPQWTYDLASLGLAMLAIGALVSVFIGLSMVTRSTVFSLIVGAVFVLSDVFAHAVGSLAIMDPAVHLPLMGDWTRSLAMQYNTTTLSLRTGLAVVVGWIGFAILFSLGFAKKLDL